MKDIIICLLMFLTLLSCDSKESLRKLFFREVSKEFKIKLKDNSPKSYLVLADYHPHYEYFTSHIFVRIRKICEINGIKALIAFEGPLSPSHFKEFQNNKFCTLKKFDQRDTSEYQRFKEEFGTACQNLYKTIHYISFRDRVDQLYPNSWDKKELLRMGEKDAIERFTYHWTRNIMPLNRDAIDINVGDYDIVIFVVGGVHGYFLHEEFSLPIIWSKSFEDQKVSDLLNIQLIVAQWLDLKGFGHKKRKQRISGFLFLISVNTFTRLCRHTPLPLCL